MTADQERALAELRRAYRDAVALGSPAPNAFANLAWILAEGTDLSTEARAEAIVRWLGSAELDRWRSPIVTGEAGKSTLASYDFRKAATEELRAAAERFVRSCGISVEGGQKES
ncbi:MAG TPA: hypothetical protein VLO07_05550 [Thermoanaerobaculia bacterium]|nr:hypothetical protein [Thermoanaerobaculia bacterium]